MIHTLMISVVVLGIISTILSSVINNKYYNVSITFIANNIGLIIIYIIAKSLNYDDTLEVTDTTQWMLLTSYVYMWFALGNLWLKPRWIALINKYTNLSTYGDLERIENLEVRIETAYERAPHYMYISIGLIIILKVIANNEMISIVNEANISFIGTSILWFVYTLIRDLYIKIRYNIIRAKILIPIGVLIWIIIVGLLI